MAQSKSNPPKGFESFDIAPDSAYVREPVVAAILSCSHATLWRWVKDGRIPSPRKLSPRVTAWNVGELRQYLATV